jgi:uncharacterized protein RhaS with RHS repeats
MGVTYYGYRYYNPELGRWLSRDPIRERGGLNLYGFADNHPVGRLDYLGLSCMWVECINALGSAPVGKHCALVIQCDQEETVKVIELHGPYHGDSQGTPRSETTERGYPYSQPKGRDVYEVEYEGDCCDAQKRAVKYQEDNPIQLPYKVFCYNSNTYVKKLMDYLGARLRPYVRTQIWRKSGGRRIEKVTRIHDAPLNAPAWNSPTPDDAVSSNETN